MLRKRCKLRQVRYLNNIVEPGPPFHQTNSRIKTTHPQPRFATLTPREKEILKFLAEGQSVKQIATHLNLSDKTVEAHKFNLYLNNIVEQDHRFIKRTRASRRHILSRALRR